MFARACALFDVRGMLVMMVVAGAVFDGRGLLVMVAAVTSDGYFGALNSLGLDWFSLPTFVA